MQLSALLAILPLVAAAPTAEPSAPLLTPREAPGQTLQVIEGSYIIKLKDSDLSISSIDAIVGALPGGRQAKHLYSTAGFKGFAGKLSAAQVEQLQKDPQVEFIEKDAVITINAYVSQTGAPWGLGRISHRAKGSTTYVYDNSAGAGTCAYIIDTGIYTAHSEFEGRATWLANYAGDGSNTDGNGHGTHVAGTVGGKTYGVAKKTKLYAVKVLNASGSGTTSGVIAGMNYVTNDAKTRSCPNGTVSNMSLGGGFSSSINSAAKAQVSGGVFLAVAAGNDGANAANYSPASETTACTVGATDINDAVASFSNFGAVVDIFAPGVNVLSSWIGSTTATRSISGTSMATPHIAGLGAYLLTLFGPKTPQALCTYIQSLATNNVITGLPSGTINKLAFNGNPTG